MKIKRLFESKDIPLLEDYLDIIKDCFIDMIDDYDAEVYPAKISNHWYGRKIFVKIRNLPNITPKTNMSSHDLSVYKNSLNHTIIVYDKIYEAIKRLEQDVKFGWGLMTFDSTDRSQELWARDCYIIVNINLTEKLSH